MVSHLLALGVLSGCIANLQTKDCCVAVCLHVDGFLLEASSEGIAHCFEKYYIKYEELVGFHIVLDHNAHHISLKVSSHGQDTGARIS